MHLVSDDKHYIRWDVVGTLITFLWECDSGTFPPAFLHGDGEDFISDAGGVAIFIHYLQRENTMMINVNHLLIGENENVTICWTN